MLAYLYAYVHFPSAMETIQSTLYSYTNNGNLYINCSFYNSFYDIASNFFYRGLLLFLILCLLASRLTNSSYACVFTITVSPKAALPWFITKIKIYLLMIEYQVILPLNYVVT